MLVKEIIKIASDMRPGNNFDSETVERWIDEVDAVLQLEVELKKPSEVIRMRPPLWERGKKYFKGERVGVKLSGEWRVFVAGDDVESEISPHEDAENWTEVPYETYVGFPHDRLYYLYVIAMMDYATLEYDKYVNDVAVYNAARDEFAKWWQRTYGYKE